MYASGAMVMVLLASAAVAHGSMDAWLSRMAETSGAAESPAGGFTPSARLGRLAPRPANGSATIVVAKDGSGHFNSVRAAVSSIPLSNSRRIIVYIKEGIYREKVVVNQSWITFQGDGPHATEIQWNDTAAKVGNTFASATVAVNGDHFTARGISFRNTAPAPRAGQVGGQAVALRISGDFAAFFDTSFYGAQDTLYDHQGRHYFYRCYIEGSVDFIFGDGRSFYTESHLHSIASPNGAVTAQRRGATSQDSGFSFVLCAVTGLGSIFLGRAWGPSSRAVFALTFLDDVVLPKGWFDWSDAARQKTVFYGEYECFGRGSDRAGRVPWSLALTRSQAAPFLTTAFVNGELWLSSA